MKLAKDRSGYSSFDHLVDALSLQASTTNG